ncbi:2-hydroxy-3-oxopropionate reductase [Chromatiales bacterium (ex Bugula neritina AB1)]|nr:2-hydroxy-3-oxopropionate reductase [Chromatiales bacterium (ex Bugula neritina AB1)]
MRVGIIGVGLMGHGIALNVLKGGFELLMMNHPGNQPVDDLIGMGAELRDSPAAVAEAADLIILCVTGSPQVKAVMTSSDGVVSALKPGTIVVDCSTALPDSTVKMASLVAEAGGNFLDAPMTRLAKQAREGTLNILVGGEAEVLNTARPVLDTFTENIDHVGGVGFGHRMKLLHNYVSIGHMALLAEAAAQAADAGVDAQVFVDVLAKGGGAGAALERLRKCILTGDSSDVPFAIGNAIKDIDYYREMVGGDTVGEGPGSRAIADGVSRAIGAQADAGHADEYVPDLARLFRR